MRTTYNTNTSFSFAIHKNIGWNRCNPREKNVGRKLYTPFGMKNVV